MFGTNPIRKVDDTTDSLLVHSLFPTMQGEGPFAGRRAVFLRLAGCSLACSWCDTEFEQDSHRIPNEALSNLIRQEGLGGTGNLCVITGGEPMRQNIAPLCRTLLKAGWQVQIETAGIHWPPGMDQMEECLIPVEGDPQLTIVCSPKTPKLNPYLEQYCWNYKYIIDADEPAADDGLPLHAVSQAHKKNSGLMFRPAGESHRRNIFVQPLHYHEDRDHTQRNIDRCVQLVLEQGYRLSLQTHKILGLP